LQSEHIVTAEAAGATVKRLAREVRGALGSRSIVLAGMMGSGKSSIGRRLAAALDLPFSDADTETEHAATTVAEIFAITASPIFATARSALSSGFCKTGRRLLRQAAAR
jgi:hypothetical protein